MPNLCDIPASTRAFIDANIFVFSASDKEGESSQFLKKCLSEEVKGFTSVSVLAETLHRLMILEAIEKKLIKKSGAWYDVGAEKKVIGMSGVKDYYIDNPEAFEDLKSQITIKDSNDNEAA